MTPKKFAAWQAALAILLSSVTSLSFANVIISEVDLANNRVELVNTGGSTVDMSSWWWCNRVNGSPFYNTMASASTIDAGLSSPGATLGSFGAGQTLVLDLTAGFLPDTDGELGLYNTNAFGSSSAIEDYLSWNNLGIRDTPASGAGLWPLNEFISFGSIPAGQTLQTITGTTGIGPTEWTIGPGTLGAVNIPEPTTLALGLLGLALTLRRR